MGKELPFRLILASASPARRDLLAQAGYAFEVIPSRVEEENTQFADVRALVEHLAWRKAKAVARQEAGDRRPETGGKELLSALSTQHSALSTLILSADTVGWLHGQVVGKPADEADARRILRLLSGSEHELWTGVCLWLQPGDVQIAWQEMTVVAMKPLTDAEMDEYLATRQWEGCSGAYAIEAGEDPYVRVVRGSRSNVIGLPMETLEKVLAWAAQHDGLALRFAAL